MPQTTPIDGAPPSEAWALFAHRTEGVPVAVAAMALEQLDAIASIEKAAQRHPWSRRNFADAMAAGYAGFCLVHNTEVLAYLVAMPCLDEAHLLNIAVAPSFQKQGLAAVLLNVLDAWALSQKMGSVWLEVRASNLRAQGIYKTHGYEQVGVRRNYYLCESGAREDALLLRLQLNAGVQHSHGPVAGGRA